MRAFGNRTFVISLASAVLFFLYAPLLVIVIFSFNDSSYILGTTTMDEVLPGLFDTGIPDVHARADLSTFRLAPWEKDTAIVLLDWVTPEGKPHPLCPRGALKRQIALADRLGFHAFASLELEFYILPLPISEVRQGRWADLPLPSKDIHCYSILEGHFCEPIIGRLRDCFPDEIEACLPEWGQGQFEVNLYRADPLAMADTAVMMKLAVKQIAAEAATAATIIPAMAERAKHITLVQRSPTYFNPGTNADDLADQLRALEIDEHWIHAIVRKKLLEEQRGRITRAATEPDAVAAELIGKVVEHLGPGVDVVKHCTPRYRPWQQRVAFIPDGDFFTPFREGKADIVTGQIERFTENGLKMSDGTEVEADIIVTATGFNLCVLGDIAFSINGVPVDFAQTVTWQGMMFTGVPNMVWVFGYFRASWTLRVEMIAEVILRILNHMDAIGARSVTVEIPERLGGMERLPWVDPDNFNPNYLMRDMHLMPRRLDLAAWQHTQDYWTEKERFAKIEVTDEALNYD